MAIDPLAHLEAVAARHEGRRLARDQVVHVGAVAAADLEDVAEAARGHERGTGTRALGERVDDDGRAVHELLDRGRLDLACGDHVEHALGEVARGRRDLGDAHLAAHCVDRDEVGERAADVGRDPQRHRARSLAVSAASGSSDVRIEGDAVDRARLLDGHVAVEHVLAHALGLALERIAEAAAGARDRADDGAVGQLHARHATTAEVQVGSRVLEEVLGAGRAAAERPRHPSEAADAAVARGLARPVHAVGAHDAEAAAVTARAAARLDVQRIALDEHRIAALDDLDGEVVGVAVGRRNQRGGAVAERAASPAADVRLREHEQLAALVAADDVRAAEARVAAGAQPLRDDGSERLPDQVVREGRALVVPPRRGGWLGAEDRAGRHGQAEGAEEAVVRARARRGDRTHHRLAGRQQRAGRAVDGPARLRRAAAEVGLQEVVADRDGHGDRDLRVAHAVAVDHAARAVDAVRDRAQLGARDLLSVIEHACEAARARAPRRSDRRPRARGPRRWPSPPGRR